MQLRLPWDAPPRRAAREPRTLEAGGRRFPVELVRHRRARRYVLRLTPDGAVRVTVPRGASIAGALRFAATEQAWIVREWTRLSVRRTWPAGTLVWWRGARIALHPADGHVPLAETAVPLGRAATPHDLRPLVQAHLAAIARTELPVRCVVLGQPHGLRPVRISVRDQRSRWGACSARGTITLNWRLVQMPPEVADYVMLHELAHLQHPNHGPRFWRAVAAICPAWRAAERWLRTHGRDLL